MTDLSGLILAKKCLMDSLGDKFPTYLKAVKLWFNMQLSKEDFDNEVRKVLNEDQMKIHNQLFIQLLKTCHEYTNAPCNTSPHMGSESEHSSKRSKLSSSKKKSRSHHNVQGSDGIKQCNTSLFRGDEPTPNRFCSQELVLPDESFLYVRMLHCAWEYDLDAVEMTAAQLLTDAVQNFLKNVVTAVLRQRSGYKVRDGSFIHALGSPVPNPWLRGVTQFNKESKRVSRHVADADDDCKPELTRPSFPHLEQQVALSISSARNSLYSTALKMQEVIDGLRAYTFFKRAPSEVVHHVLQHCQRNLNHFLTDPFFQCFNCLWWVILVHLTLQVNRSVIQSHMMYTTCMERLLLTNTHPSWDEFGE